MVKRIAVLVTTVTVAALVLPLGPVASAQGTPADWRPWALSSADEFRIDAPPADDSRRTTREIAQLLRHQSERTRAIRRRVRRFDSTPVTVPWTKLGLQMIRDYRPRPPFAARVLAVLHAAMFDALIAAEDSRLAYDRAQPVDLDDRIRPLVEADGSGYPSLQAVVAGAAESALTYLFPREPASTFEGRADTIIESRLYAGTNYRSDLTRGRELGRSVGAKMVSWASGDGSTSTTPAHPRPAGQDYWEPTPPGYETPAGGPVGTWRPWVMADGAEARRESGISPPPEYGSEEFMAEVEEMLDGQANLTSEQKQIAVFWDDGPGTFTPAGHWNEIALDLVESAGTSTNETARLFAYLNAAEIDSAIAFFESKYLWWSIRPVSAIRRLCDGGERLCTVEELKADPSRATYPDWLPYIITPPFPSYPSGHSTLSGSASRVIGAFFPSAAEALDSFAEEAADSRFYGGIHFKSDNAAGLELGRWIAAKTLERAAEDGS